MRHISIVGLCLLAALAASAIAVASASAATPEYLACGKAAKSGKKYTGKYTNKTCSAPSATNEGKYELVKPKFPAKVKGTIGKVNIYLYNPMEHPTKIEGHFQCASGKDKGELTGSREGKIALTYSHCEATGKLVGPCNSTGQKPGVVAEELATKLVWLNEAETEPGIEMTAAKAPGSITDVECDKSEGKALETSELFGAIFGKVGPTSEALKTETLTIEASETTGEPTWDGFYEGGVFTHEKLYAKLEGLIAHPEVPVGQSSVFSQKGPAILVGD